MDALFHLLANENDSMECVINCLDAIRSLCYIYDRDIDVKTQELLESKLIIDMYEGETGLDILEMIKAYHSRNDTIVNAVIDIEAVFNIDHDSGDDHELHIDNDFS